MPALIDLAGYKFNRLLVLERVPGSPHPHWRCLCDCGRETVATSPNLKNDKHKSCGCLKEVQNGLSRKHPLWQRWVGMINRCENPYGRNYRNYGERGIKVCKRWRESFLSFLEDMEASFFPGASIDRINVNGDYEPGNCRWATQKEQGRNTRFNHLIDTDWGRVTIAEAAERAGISRYALRSRIIDGWPSDKWFIPHRTYWSRKFKYGSQKDQSCIP